MNTRETIKAQVDCSGIGTVTKCYRVTKGHPPKALEPLYCAKRHDGRLFSFENSQGVTFTSQVVYLTTLESARRLIGKGQVAKLGMNMGKIMIPSAHIHSLLSGEPIVV